MNWSLTTKKDMENNKISKEEYEQVRNGKCPHCKGELKVPIVGMLFFKGLYFSKLVCTPCDKEWTNSKDVMLDRADDVMNKEGN